MTCSLDDLKAYAVGELTRREQTALEDHVRACQNCREELDRLNLMRSALATLEDEEPPRRIAFVSDRVFEPRWWQTIWHSGPAMGFASAALLAGAILVHGFARPLVPVTASVNTAQIEQRVESQVNARLDAAVSKAVAVSEARQSAEFDKTLKAVETRFESQVQAQSATVQQAADYYREKMAQFLVASNEGPAR
jgi:anti-sigma factor RsiW